MHQVFDGAVEVEDVQEQPHQGDVRLQHSVDEREAFGCVQLAEPEPIDGDVADGAREEGEAH